MRAIGYIRVSTDEQAREGVSLENQAAKVRGYCDLHEIDLEGVIQDSGKSGKSLNREGMQELINMIKTRSIDAVIVYKLDRLSRRVIDTLTLVELMQKNGVEFVALIDQIDTKTAIGKFFLNIMASLAQMERDLISERTKDALQHKISKNERAGQIPYGWELLSDGKRLVRKEEEQRIIKLVKTLHEERNSYRSICKELMGRGYEPIGKRWHPQTVKNILRRNIITGG